MERVSIEKAFKYQMTSTAYNDVIDQTECYVREDAQTEQ